MPDKVKNALFEDIRAGIAATVNGCLDVINNGALVKRVDADNFRFEMPAAEGALSSPACVCKKGHVSYPALFSRVPAQEGTRSNCTVNNGAVHNSAPLPEFFLIDRFSAPKQDGQANYEQLSILGSDEVRVDVLAGENPDVHENYCVIMSGKGGRPSPDECASIMQRADAAIAAIVTAATAK